MQSVVQAVLRSWSIPPAATLALLLTAFTYLRGAWLLRRAGYPNLPTWRIYSFSLGLFALWFALASPLDTFSGFVLTAHMLQHMILMMVAPPLLLLGEPLIPIVRGMPRFAAREFAGPFLNWHVSGRIGQFLTYPVTALILMGAVMFIWHVPGPYELAVRSSAWHQFEHACFFFASIIFWWPVVQPWPSRSQWPRWAMVPYLVIADLQNTVLSAVLVFSDRLLYPSYGAGPSLFGFPPQEDQAAAGAIMWVVGSLAFLVPAALIAVQILSHRKLDYLASTKAASIVHVDAIAESDARRSRVSSPKTRFQSPSFQTASFIILFVVVSVGFVLLAHSGTDDDDQVLRGWQQSGPFVIALYGPEGNIPAGPVSFAVLVQEQQSRAIVMDSEVSLTLRRHAREGEQPKVTAASAGDENKLLFVADTDIEAAGSWDLVATVRRGAESASVSFPVEATAPDIGPTYAWQVIAMPVIAVILAGMYFFRHRAARMAGTAPSTT